MKEHERERRGREMEREIGPRERGDGREVENE